MFSITTHRSKGHVSMAINSVFKIGFVFVAVCAVIAVFYNLRTHTLQQVTEPSDDELIRIFQANRGEIDKLRQMATEDMLVESFFSESNISNKLPAPRRDEYRKLLKFTPGLQVGANYDGSVRFIFAGAGQAISPGWAKGIQFIPDGAKFIGIRKPSLEDTSKLSTGVYLRKIEPRWFLFYQRDE